MLGRIGRFLEIMLELSVAEPNAMKDIRLTDIHRLLFGNSPTEFLIEAGIRTAITFALLVILMKLLGKRMDGKVSVLEMAIIITIGAMAAVAFHFSDRGILHAATALTTVLIVHKIVSFFIFRSEWAEHVIQGAPRTLVENGVMCLDAMQHTRISRENIMSILREHHILNIGQVRRLYLEASGMFSIYLEPERRAGLCVLSPAQWHLLNKNIDVSHSILACCHCGNTKEHDKENKPCSNCGKISWVNAVTEK
jgi:uncharacterized membrane protein YcaP (DUF421 family)